MWEDADADEEDEDVDEEEGEYTNASGDDDAQNARSHPVRKPAKTVPKANPKPAALPYVFLRLLCCYVDH